MLKETLKKGAISFAISSFAGALINFIIDLVAAGLGATNFCSISPEFLALFPTTVMAVYVNIFLYGVIGATFSMMTFIYEFDRIGFVVQSVIYCVVTGSICLLITTLLWQLQRYPTALICTILGYALTHVIMVTIEYTTLKKEIKEINLEIGEV